MPIVCVDENGDKRKSTRNGKSTTKSRLLGNDGVGQNMMTTSRTAATMRPIPCRRLIEAAVAVREKRADVDGALAVAVLVDTLAVMVGWYLLAHFSS